MQTVVATFDDKQMAQRAVSELTANGFPSESIHLQTAQSTDGDRDSDHAASHGGFMAEVEHFFSHLFGADSDDKSGNYAEAVRRGSAVVAVDTPTDAELEKAKTVMQNLGSIDVDARANEWKSQGWTGFDPASQPYTDDEQAAERRASERETADRLAVERQAAERQAVGAEAMQPQASERRASDDQAAERQAVPVVKEEIRVGKRTVDTGGLRVVKRMTEVPVSQIINLREERATVERRPADREATEGDFAAFKEGTVEIREQAEEPVVAKTARVVEEVVVGKEVSEHPETVSDTVRRTDVDVERLGEKEGTKRTTRSRKEAGSKKDQP